MAGAPVDFESAPIDPNFVEDLKNNSIRVIYGKVIPPSGEQPGSPANDGAKFQQLPDGPGRAYPDGVTEKCFVLSRPLNVSPEIAWALIRDFPLDQCLNVLDLSGVDLRPGNWTGRKFKPDKASGFGQDPAKHSDGYFKSFFDLLRQRFAAIESLKCLKTFGFLGYKPRKHLKDLITGDSSAIPRKALQSAQELHLSLESPTLLQGKEEETIKAFFDDLAAAVPNLCVLSLPTMEFHEKEGIEVMKMILAAFPSIKELHVKLPTQNTKIIDLLNSAPSGLSIIAIPGARSRDALPDLRFEWCKQCIESKTSDDGHYHFNPGNEEDEDDAMSEDIDIMLSLVDDSSQRFAVDSAKNELEKRRKKNKKSRDLHPSKASRNIAVPSVLAGIWNLDKLPAPKADVRICILDSGVDPTHPWLTNKPITGRSFVPGTTFYDDNYHGTFIAGLIAGEDPEGTDAMGICTNPQFKLYCGKTSHRGRTKPTHAKAGLCWAIHDVKADVICLSVGNLSDNRERFRLLHHYIADGGIVVVSASNYGQKYRYSIGYPARYGSMLCIGSHDENGQVSRFSSAGREVDFLAPGENILSLWPGGDFFVSQGTSFSAPLVAGLAARLKSLNKYYTIAEIREILREISTSPGYHDHSRGHGPVNPAAWYDDKTKKELVEKAELAEKKAKAIEKK